MAGVRTARPAKRFARLRDLVRADGGAALTEFGLISPALFVLLFGAFDVGHTLYMRSVLQGAVQKAARDASLESASGTDDEIRDAIDESVEGQILPLNSNATVAVSRRFYRTFTDAAEAEAEEFTDSATGMYNNDLCDNNEPFEDVNNNGVRDGDGGDSINRAGARDNVVYTVTVSYPRLFPLHMFIDVPDQTRLQASTVLANQPYGDQASYDAPTTGHCP
jgi:Flp pilus assembly protein TadG